MRKFILKMPAYHFLERNHYASISESGDLVTNTNSRVRYFITLDKSINHWIYYSYSNNKNEFYEYELKENSHLCAVYPGFEQAAKFNY